MRPERVLPFAFALLAITGCLSDTSPGGEVGSETHFLSACVSHEQCPSDLQCLCGVCTNACSDSCALGVCAAGDSAAAQSYCGGPRETGLCLAACDENAQRPEADPACAVCEGGLCLSDPRVDGARCEVAAQCEGGACTLGFCGPPCMLPEPDCEDGTSCYVPGAASGVCLPGVLESFPSALDGGAILLGDTKDMELVLASRVDRALTVSRISVETLDRTQPTEVSVATALPAALTPLGQLAVQVRLAPSRAGVRPYRLVVRVDEEPVWLEVPITFSGAAP